MYSRIRNTLNAGIAALTVGTAVIALASTPASAFSLGGFGHMGGFGHTGSFGHTGGFGHTGSLGHTSASHSLGKAGHLMHAERTNASRATRTAASGKTPPDKTVSDKTGSESASNTDHGATSAKNSDAKPSNNDKRSDKANAPGGGGQQNATPAVADEVPRTQEKPGTGTSNPTPNTPELQPQWSSSDENGGANDNWEIEQRRQMRELAQERNYEGLPPDEQPAYLPPVSLSTEPVEEPKVGTGGPTISRGLQEFIDDYSTVDMLLTQANKDDDTRAILQLESMQEELAYIIYLYTTQGANAVNNYFADQSRQVLYSMIKITASSANLAIAATTTAVNNSLPGGANSPMPTRLARTPEQVKAMIKAIAAGAGNKGAATPASGLTPPRADRNADLMQGGSRPALSSEPAEPATSATNAAAETPATNGGQNLVRRLDAALAKYYGGKPQPPMHTTTRAALGEIVATKKLEAPARGGASWSTGGTLRNGDVAIRLKAGAEQYVKFVRSTQGEGLVPYYYPAGVGNGAFKTYIPTQYLEYFNTNTGEWRLLP